MLPKEKPFVKCEELLESITSSFSSASEGKVKVKQNDMTQKLKQ